MDLSLNVLLTGALVLSRFFPGALDPVTMFQSANPRAELVKTFSQMCMAVRANPDVADRWSLIEGLMANAEKRMKAPPKRKITIEIVDSSKSDSDRLSQKPLGLVKGLTEEDLVRLYRGICKTYPDVTVFDEVLSDEDLESIFDKYRSYSDDMPDYTNIENVRLAQASAVKTSDGVSLGEVVPDNGRRQWVSVRQIPEFLQQAFVSAEDKRFWSHQGVDPVAVVRAVYSMAKKGNLSGGRPQGASTITQQVARNLYLDTSLSFDRKFKEMIVAGNIESHLRGHTTFYKKRIMELYLNLIYLGRGNWGVQRAVQSYFGKDLKLPQVGANRLTLAEAAFLAGITNSPGSYDPINNPEKVKNRQKYVLGRMLEDGAITQQQHDEAINEEIKYKPAVSTELTQPYFMTALKSSMNQFPFVTSGAGSQGGSRFTLIATLDLRLQKIVDEALMNGLYSYEKRNKRFAYKPLGQIDDLDGESWHDQLKKQGISFPELGWEAAVVLEKGKSATIGLADGSQSRLFIKDIPKANPSVGDLVAVEKIGSLWFLRQPPQVQGAVVVMDPYSGHVLAIKGGFSFNKGSQTNRAISAYRQVGSTLKPLTYLAALQSLDPDSQVMDRPVSTYKGRPWPSNYDHRSWGAITMREALANSRNQATAWIMKNETGIDPILNLSVEMGIYDSPRKEESFVLGAQETTLLRMTTAYAMIANGGFKVRPRFIKDIFDSNGNRRLTSFTNSRSAGFSQTLPVTEYSIRSLQSMLSDVVRVGTASRMSHLASFVGGKTGTTDNQNDAWFIGFTNSLVVGVWVGYDNNNGKRHLGDKQTGGKVALPIFQEIIERSFEEFSPRTPLVMGF